MANIQARKIRKMNSNEIISNEMNFEIPKINEYDTFINKNYRVSFLKEICKSYKLKISGNKPELTNRIYTHLINTYNVIIIQKYIRRYFRQNYNKLVGPALFNRALCMNSTDFFTLENIDKISYNEFISYKSNIDNSIWGFNITSLYNLCIKSEQDILNPYTREKIDIRIMFDLNKIITYNILFKQPLKLTIDTNLNNLSIKKQQELKTLELFQYIDELGNYTDIKWFTSLNRFQLIKFIRELTDIWEYRSQLNDDMKRQICYPYGNPFRYIDLNNITYLAYYPLQKIILSVIEQFVKKGTSRENSNLGASYVLCALTLVNNNAAEALPWLYHSVVNIE